VPTATICSCGAKIRADRAICPRCRQPLKAQARAAAAAAAVEPSTGGVSPRIISFVAIALIGLAAGVPWMRSGSDSTTTMITTPPVDPLASRRPRPAPATPEPAASTPAVPYAEAKSEGAVSYVAGDYATAEERYRAAVEKNPQDAESLSNLGQVLVRTGKVEEAIPYFDRAIAIIPQRWAYHFNRARALGLLGRMEEAVKGYRAAQALFPNDYATAFNLGLALHKMGDEAGAVEAYNKAIALDPNDATFHMALGTSLERLQRPRDAAAAYEQYLKLSPSAVDAEQVRARISQLTQSPAAPQQPGS